MMKWKLVPVEPTPEIDYAMRQELPDNQETYGASFLVRAIWKAALAAAPTPPAQVIEPYTNAIATLRCLSVDESLSEGWRDWADRAANELSAALDKS